MSGYCLPPYFLMDDRVRLLTAHELKGFLAFALLAARSRREPGVIAAMPPEMRAKKLGMALKIYEKRLERLTAPGIELIEVRADGALVLADLWEDEDEEWDGGPEGGAVAPKSGTVRVQKYRERLTAAKAAGAAAGHQNGSNGVGNAEALQNGHQSVTSGVTAGAQNGTGGALHQALPPRGRVGDVSNVSGVSKESLDSRDVSNVAAPPPVTPPVTLPAPPQPVSGPYLRPALRLLDPQEVRVAKRVEVDTVMRLVGDAPDWKGLWFALWNHCHAHDLLHCWDQGAAFLVERLRTSPPAGRGSVRNRGKWLRTVIMVLVANAGHTYAPAGAGDQAGGEPEPPVDEAEAADIRRSMEEIRARWAAEEEATAGDAGAK